MIAWRIGAGDSGSGALRCGGRPPVTVTQAERSGQLSNEEVAFGVGLRGPLGVAYGASLLDVAFDLGETSAVGVLGAPVEHLARVAERQRALGGCPPLPVSAATRSSTWYSRPGSASNLAR